MEIHIVCINVYVAQLKYFFGDFFFIFFPTSSYVSILCIVVYLYKHSRAISRNIFVNKIEKCLFTKLQLFVVVVVYIVGRQMRGWRWRTVHACRLPVSAQYIHLIINNWRSGTSQRQAANIRLVVFLH